jgi:hypothetical protein
MVPKANPIPTKGERNIYCPFYNSCLDYAIRDSWETWNCSQCPHRIIKQVISEFEYEINEIDPDYDLPSDIRWVFKIDVFD